MDELQKIWQRHSYIAKASTAFMYGILVSIAMNFFWTPGHIYSSGITGLSQLITSITSHTSYPMSTAVMLFILNVPLFILAWLKIGHRFTIFTILAVFSSSLMIKMLTPLKLTTDPIICSIFGAAINGFGTGIALKNGISTGGLDILGLTIRRKTGKSIGTINLIFNFFIVFAAGVVYGWPYAFYSALGLLVNARVMDMIYTRQQKMQVMIVTENPDKVVKCIQKMINHGITIIHGAEGAYLHDKKSILLTVISRDEQGKLRLAMQKSDPKAFVSISDNVHIMGHFREPKV